MSPEDGSLSMSAEVKLYGGGKINACADKTTGVNAKKVINNLIFIILQIWLMVSYFCKYTHFSMAAKKNLSG